MATLIIPRADEEPWPTLGPAICDWVEANLTYGPGDMRGIPYIVEPEFRALIYRSYEVLPKGSRGAGRRRFNRVGWNIRKGTAKTEKAAIIAACELHPDAPVRFDGWDAYGEPVGRGVVEPYVAMVAYTLEQTEELGFNVLRTILQDGALAEDFDIGLERIVVMDARGRAAGKAVPLTGAPGARDGARTTHNSFDEPLALDTPIPTTDGWKAMGEITVGDFVFDREGHPTEVVGLSDVHEGRACYRVTFDDGSSVVTDAAHRWRVYKTTNWAKGEQVVTTGQMFDEGVVGGQTGWLWRLPPSGGIDGVEAELPIDPYLLGMWLGDGSTDAGYIHSAHDDYREMSIWYPHTVADDHGNPLVRWLPKGLRSLLRGEGLLGSKHIPQAYLLSSREQRLELLRGLMDTDGHATPSGHCTFVQGKERLARDVAELVRSLGCPASMTVQVDPRSRTGVMNKVHFTPDFTPFRLQRKALKADWSVSRRKPMPVITSIEDELSVPVRCLAIDNDDHLFVFGRSYMLTHNTHRMTTPRLIKAHTTMLQNTYKRQMADAWSLETTTMYDPTELSVAKDTHEYAQEVADGKIEDSRLFYFYRYAPLDMPLDTVESVTAALTEASGPAVAWSGDIDGLAKHWFEPNTDKQYYQRVWLNQKVAGGGKAFDSAKWDTLVNVGHVVADRAKIAIGFDGAKNRDGTAIVAVDLAAGWMWTPGYWQAPDGDDEWMVDPDEVEQTLEQLFDRYKVQRMYGDPYYWTTEMRAWAGRWGDNRVLEYATTQYKRIGLACKSLAVAISDGQVTHDGGSILTAHIGNAVRQELNLRGDDETPLWTISKERRGGPLKIDAAMAAVLAWQAANDAIAKGALKGSSGVHSFN